MQARQIRSALANNQPSELMQLVEEAHVSGPESVDSFQQLLILVIRQLDLAEKGNGVSAILAAAKVNETLRGREIARSVASVVALQPKLIGDGLGGLTLLDDATNDSAQIIGKSILEVANDTSDNEIWKARSLLRKFVSQTAFDNWLARRINDIDSWERFVAWAEADLDNHTANLLLWQAVELSADTQDEYLADSTSLESVISVVAKITEPRPPEVYPTLKKAVSQPADTYECAIALEASKGLEMSESNLANLSSTAFPASIASPS